jgi:hypothetical protein
MAPRRRDRTFTPKQPPDSPNSGDKGRFGTLGTSYATAAGQAQALAAIAAVQTCCTSVNNTVSGLPTAAQNADQVWDEILAGHLNAGSTGFTLNTINNTTQNTNSIVNALGGSYGDLWYVSPTGNDANTGTSWTDAFRTLQAAHDAATTNNGDTVFVAPGTYDYTANGAAGVTITKNNINFEGIGSGNSIQNTDANNTGSVFTVSGDYITFRNLGIDKGEGASLNARIVYADGASFLRIEDCAIAVRANTHTAVYYDNGCFGCDILTGSRKMGYIYTFASGIGTGVRYENASTCFIDSYFIFGFDVGVYLAAAGDNNQLTRTVDISTCDTGIYLAAGASNNILSANIVDWTTAAYDDQSGNATNQRRGSPTFLMQDISHVPKFGGDIWFVDATNGLDTNTGISPEQAFQTIVYAISQMAAGDRLYIRQDTYDEAGININKVGLEIMPEIGTIIQDSTGAGAVITVSSNYCTIAGTLTVTCNASGAATLGVNVTGNFNIIRGPIRVAGSTTAWTNSGNGNNFYECFGGQPTTYGFNLGGSRSRLYDCDTGGALGATTGYYITGDYIRITNCVSSGHSTHGFHLTNTTSYCTMISCRSGGGDGALLDEGDLNTKSGYTFDGAVGTWNGALDNTITITNVAGAHAYNIFKVTGTVRIYDIIGEVTTAVVTDAGANLKLEAYSGAPSTADITDDPGIVINGFVVGAMMVRNGDSGTDLDYINPSGTVGVMEPPGGPGGGKNAIDIVADVDNDSYIRAYFDDDTTSGAIKWSCRWEPLSDDGFLEAV